MEIDNIFKEIDKREKTKETVESVVGEVMPRPTGDRKKQILASIQEENRRLVNRMAEIKHDKWIDDAE